jgi:hypothetical protein
MGYQELVDDILNKVRRDRTDNILELTVEELGYGLDFEERDWIKHFDYDLIDGHGGEGEGENYWRVYYFPKYNCYLKITGSYQSYDGVNWDYGDYYEVFPKEKTITVYE